jgi:hypothetical protein
MPTETIVTLTAITFVFLAFGGVLAWAERQTRNR